MPFGRIVTVALAVLLCADCRRKPDAKPDAKPDPAAAAQTPPAPAPPSRPPPPQAPDAAALGPDYDPTKLSEEGAEPVKIYLAEPRHAAWATAVEDVVGGQLTEDVRHVAGGGGVSMGCRTLSCLILVDAPADKMELALGVVQLVALGPITVNLGRTPEGRGQVLFLTEPRMADPATFTGWYKRTRRKTLDDIRAGSRANPLPVPVSQLPP